MEILDHNLTPKMHQLGQNLDSVTVQWDQQACLAIDFVFQNSSGKPKYLSFLTSLRIFFADFQRWS